MAVRKRKPWRVERNTKAKAVFLLSFFLFLFSFFLFFLKSERRLRWQFGVGAAEVRGSRLPHAGRWVRPGPWPGSETRAPASSLRRWGVRLTWSLGPGLLLVCALAQGSESPETGACGAQPEGSRGSPRERLQVLWKRMPTLSSGPGALGLLSAPFYVFYQVAGFKRGVGSISEVLERLQATPELWGCLPGCEFLSHRISLGWKH